MKIRSFVRGLLVVLLVTALGCMDRCAPKIVFQFPIVDEDQVPVGRDVGEAVVTVTVGHPPRAVATKKVKTGGAIFLTGPAPAGTSAINIVAETENYGAASREVEYDPDRKTYDVRLQFQDVDQGPDRVSLVLRLTDATSGSAVGSADVSVSMGAPPSLAWASVVSDGGSVELIAPSPEAPVIRVVGTTDGYRRRAATEVEYVAGQTVYDVHLRFGDDGGSSTFDEDDNGDRKDPQSVAFNFWLVDHEQKQIGQLDQVAVTILGRTSTIDDGGSVTFQSPAGGGPIAITVRKSGYETLVSPQPIAGPAAPVRPHARQAKFAYLPRTYTLPVVVQSGGSPVEGVTVTAQARGSKEASATTDATGAATLRVQGRPLQSIDIGARNDFLEIPDIPAATLGEEAAALAQIDIDLPSTQITVRTVPPSAAYADRTATVKVEARKMSNGVNVQSATLGSAQLMPVDDEITVTFPTPKAGAGEVVITGVPTAVGLAKTEVPYRSGSAGAVELRFVEDDPIAVTVECVGTVDPTAVNVFANDTALTYDPAKRAHSGDVPAGTTVTITASGTGLAVTKTDGERLPLVVPVRAGAKQAHASIRAAWQPLRLLVTAVATGPGGEKRGVSGASVRVTNAAGKVYPETTDATGNAAVEIEAGVGDVVQFTVTPNDEAIGGEGSGSITAQAERTVTVTPSFQLLRELRLTVLDARKATPVADVTATAAGANLAVSDAEGLISAYLPAAGPAEVDLRADGYLDETYRPSADSGLLVEATRYLLNITPPKHTIAVAEVSVAEGTPIDSQIHRVQKPLTDAVRRALQDQMRSTQALRLVEEVVEVRHTDPGWDQGIQAQFVVFPTLLDPTGFDMQLSVEAYEVATGRLRSSAVAGVTPQLVGRTILTEIGPRLKANLPLYGYVVASSPGNLEMNIGTTHEVGVDDPFDVLEVERAPNGRFVADRPGDTGLLVVDVGPDSADVRVAAGRQMPLGTRLDRRAISGRPVALTVNGIPAEAVGRRTVTVEWRVQGEAVWQVGGRRQVSSAPDMVFDFEAGTEAIELGVRHSEGYASRPVQSGYESIDEDMNWPPAQTVPVAVETDPPGSNVQLGGSRAGALPIERAPVNWRIRAGQYTLTAFAPPNLAGYTDTETDLNIDLGDADTPGRSSVSSPAATVTQDADGVRVFIQVVRDVMVCIEAADGVYDSMLDCVVGMTPDHPQYISAKMALGQAALPDRPDYAIEAFEEILRADDRHPFAHYNVGYAWSLVPDWSRAIDSFLESAKYLHRVEDAKLMARLRFDIRNELVLAHYENSGAEAATTEAAYSRFVDAHRTWTRGLLTSEEQNHAESALATVNALLRRSR
jgi:hypothetical protein